MDTNTFNDVLKAQNSVVGDKTEVVIFRNQKEVKKWVELKSKK